MTPPSQPERRWTIVGTKGNRPNVVRGPQVPFGEEVIAVPLSALQKEKAEREAVEQRLPTSAERERLGEILRFVSEEFPGNAQACEDIDLLRGFLKRSLADEPNREESPK